jgi:hypothetical protein
VAGISTDENQSILIEGGTDGSTIGNEGDALKVTSAVSNGEQINFNELMCLLRDQLRQLRIITVHLQELTDLDLIDGDEEGY